MKPVDTTQSRAPAAGSTAGAGPRFSVIIPTFNRASVLPRALDSVLAQSAPAHDIIVVDDGSTDGTQEAVASYLSRTGNVRYVRQRNAGPGAARNAGIAAAEGDWVAFLDSDDQWAPDKLRHVVDLLKQAPHLDFVHSNAAFVQQDKHILDFDGIPASSMIDPRFLLTTFTIKTPTVTVRRALLDRLGYHFMTARRTCEDFELWWRVLLLAREVGYVSSRDTTIFISDDGLSRRNRQSYLIRDNVFALGRVLQWIRDRDPDCPYREALERKRYWEFRCLLKMRLQRIALLGCAADLRFGMTELGTATACRALFSAIASLGSVEDLPYSPGVPG